LKLLITSIYYINDFQVYLNLTKLENLLYQYEDTIIVFVHTNFYKQHLQNKSIEDVTLNNLQNLKGEFKGYKLNLFFYKKMVTHLLSIKHEIKEIKVHIPNDKYIQFNAEILIKELNHKDYQLEFDNNINRRTENEVFNIVEFNNYKPLNTIEANLYQTLAYFQFRMDISYFIKRIFLQKTTVTLDTINLDVLLMLEFMNNMKNHKNIKITNIDDKTKKFNNIKFLNGFNFENDIIQKVDYNYVNLEHYLKLNFDKDKIELVKPAKFKKFDNFNLLYYEKNVYIIDFEINQIKKIEEIEYFSISNLLEFMKPYNSLNNIVWNLRNLSNEFELDNDNFIINSFNDVKRISNLIKNFNVKLNVDNIINEIFTKIYNKESFENFIQNDYSNLLVYFINDLSLSLKQEQKPIGVCPICSKGFIYDNEKAFFCMECDFKLFKNTLEVFKLKKLTRLDVKNLIEKKFIYKRLKNKQGKTYFAKFILNQLKKKKNNYNLKILNNQGKFSKKKKKLKKEDIKKSN
jgi:hypothetical protein